MVSNIEDIKEFFHEFTAYRATDEALLRKAFTASENKRLAFVGGPTLMLALRDDWFLTGNSTAAGQDTMEAIISNANLQRRAHEVGLGAYITVNAAQRGQPPSPTVLLETMQAVIGLVWRDSEKNLDVVKAAIVAMGL